jgi:hypothetical protein
VFSLAPPHPESQTSDRGGVERASIMRKIGIHDNFFALRANFFSKMRANCRLRDQMDRLLLRLDLFWFPTNSLPLDADEPPGIGKTSVSDLFRPYDAIGYWDAKR